VQCVAEGDEALVPTVDGVRGVADRVTWRQRGVDAREDLLAVADRTDVRRHGRQSILARPTLGGQVAAFPLGRRDEIGGVCERRLVVAGHGAPCPSQVVWVQVGDGDGLDLTWLAAESTKAVQQLTAVQLT
jgi:hypothetical protein